MYVVASAWAFAGCWLSVVCLRASALMHQRTSTLDLLGIGVGFETTGPGDQSCLMNSVARCVAVSRRHDFHDGTVLWREAFLGQNDFVARVLMPRKGMFNEQGSCFTKRGGRLHTQGSFMASVVS